MRTYTVLFLLITTLYSYAQNNFVFRHIDIVDGLSDNQIRGLGQTSDARISVKTTTSLNLFNGATFEYFYHDKRKIYNWDYPYHPEEYHDIEGRIWMKGIGELLIFDINTNSYIYDIDNYFHSFGVTDPIKNLFIDDSKNFWFINEDNTVCFYDIQQKELITITEGNSEFTHQYGVPYELTQYKNLCWIVYTSGLIRCWDYASQEFVLQDTNFLNIINDYTYIVAIHPSPDGNLWLMYENTISYYNRTDKVWKEIATTKGNSNYFTCMDLDMDGNVWVGSSRSGLIFIDKNTFNVTEIPGMNLNTGGTLKNDIYSIFVDENNGVWIGTLFQGICYYHPGMRKFRLMHTVESDTQITNETIRCFLENEDGTILIGTGNGLYKFYPKTERIERVYNQIKGLCLSLFRDSKNRVWVSTFYSGVYCIENNHVKVYNSEIEAQTGRPIVRAIYENPTGDYWISVHGGIGKFDPETGRVFMLRESFPKIERYAVSYDFFPINETSFAVVNESGIYFYDAGTDSIWVPDIDSLDNPQFPSPNTKYYSLYEDRRSLKWYATELGLMIWDDSEKKNYILRIEQGLPNNTISGIIEDEEGIMWVSSANGISRIELTENESNYTFSIVNFSTIDGLQSGKFYDRSMLRAKDGTIYFGGIHGFNYFNPQKIAYNKSINKPIFTSFSLFNSFVKEGTTYNGRVILDRSIDKTEEITLQYNENFITLEFSGLNYANPAQTYYRYKLENFDQEWTETVADGLGKVIYTGLRPGKYTLIVYTANNDKLWGPDPARLKITITPPFWATSYAITLYIFLIIVVLIFVVNYVDKRNQKKLKEEKEQNERAQKEELDQLKFRFFTNISHEFRTPLTLIITPLETLIKQQADVSLKKRLVSIHQNANNLLNLVNQVLDFRKLEMKGERLYLKKGNFIQLVESIYVQFKDTLINKKIDFTLESEIDTVIMYYDQDKIHKIVNNLLSNALKFTAEGGHISIHINFYESEDSKYVRLSISDDGAGISDEDKKQIFTRFYQSNTKSGEHYGSGIGLHLVKEYVDLHEGKITVDSKLGAGSTFTVLIPTDLSEENENFNDNKLGEEDDSPTEKYITPVKKILLVEDNEEFRSFLAEQLGTTFQIVEAENGKIGEQAAIYESPDLIVSDLMMPEMDGIELCKRLKSDIQTSHIPFIMLTAKSSDEAKMEGYDAGADSYIAKPFSFEMLLIRINKLIEQQEKRKEQFHKTIEVTPSSITTSSLDQELVKKALLYVEQNMDNTEYSVDNLSADIGLSRSQLYRKLQSITGLTPIEFIRSIRLKRAAQLLINSQYNVSEIIDMSGFSTHKYFNKYFKEEFGMTPTQFRQEKCKKIEKD